MEATVKRSERPSWYTPGKTWQEHFWLYTDKPENEEIDCWTWCGAFRKKDGYSQMEVQTPEGVRLLRTAHQASWLIKTGSTVGAGLVLRHTCDNKQCVNPHHLLPGTQRENIQDMVNRGRNAKGERIPQSKLTNDKVRLIRRRVSEGEKQITIAKELGVSTSSINRVVKLQRWTHVKD